MLTTKEEFMNLNKRTKIWQNDLASTHLSQFSEFVAHPLANAEVTMDAFEKEGDDEYFDPNRMHQDQQANQQQEETGNGMDEVG